MKCGCLMFSRLACFVIVIVFDVLLSVVIIVVVVVVVALSSLLSPSLLLNVGVDVIDDITSVYLVDSAVLTNVSQSLSPGGSPHCARCHLR